MLRRVKSSCTSGSVSASRNQPRGNLSKVSFYILFQLTRFSFYFIKIIIQEDPKRHICVLRFKLNWFPRSLILIDQEEPLPTEWLLGTSPKNQPVCIYVSLYTFMGYYISYGFHGQIFIQGVLQMWKKRFTCLPKRWTIGFDCKGSPCYLYSKDSFLFLFNLSKILQQVYNFR